MNAKQTWLWVLLAAGLFAALLLHDRYAPKPDTRPVRLLPGLNVSNVTSVEILPANQAALRADRTNGGWQLANPHNFPAPAVAVESLLAALAQTIPDKRLTASEIRSVPDANEKYGFSPPPFTVILQPGDQHIQLGHLTAPGDQMFVRVVGTEGVSLVSADLLTLIPRTPNDWRETALVNFARLDFDRLVVTNAGKILELHHPATNHVWQMDAPMVARVDTTKLAAALEKLSRAHATNFLDTPRTELDAYGLNAPDLTLTFKRGTNTVLRLAFGKSPTNDATLIYARRNDEKTVLAVAKELLEPWRGSYETFRDRHLISSTGPLAAIEFHGEDVFTLRRTNRTWMVTPQNFPADPVLVADLLKHLGGLEVAQFYNDVVVAPDLPKLGFTAPSYRLILQATNAGSLTNLVVGEIDFGTNDNAVIYARRADEKSFAYSVKLEDFLKLPANALQLRARRIWNFTTNDVAKLTIRQNGKVRQLIRLSPGKWSLAAGSQGILDDVQIAAIEETAFRLGELAAESWVERGGPNRERYGFKPDGLQVSIDLLNGEKLAVEFGGEASQGSPYAWTLVEQEPWVFEFPPVLYQIVQLFLAIPAGTP